MIVDEFRGDDAKLRASIEALLNLDAAGALQPHGVGGHGRALLAAAYCRLDRPGRADFLNPSDMRALQRFHDLLDDGEDYDIPKDHMKRLAELGVVQGHGFGRYSVTRFGSWVMGGGPCPTPLQTIEEFNDNAGAAHRARMKGAPNAT